MSETGRRVLAVVAAREGSKRLPGKHLLPLGGKPLVAHTLEAAVRAKCVTRVVCSTDSEAIQAVAMACGAEAPFSRPPELCGDNVVLYPVVRHALEHMEGLYGRFDFVVLLQPTSPLRRAVHIDQALNMLFDTGADSVVSIRATHDNPYWMRVIDGKRLRLFIADRSGLSGNQSQDLPPVYLPNGAIYASRREVLLEEGRLEGDDVRPYLMAPEDSVDIDTRLDYLLARIILEERPLDRGQAES